MALEVPRLNEVYQITDEGGHYDFIWDPNYLNDEYHQAGDISTTICKPPPHAGTGASAPDQNIQWTMPTAYLGSQAAYPEPVIAVQFSTITVGMARQWTWACSCGAGCVIGRNYAHAYADILDINGDLVDHEFFDSEPLSHSWHFAERPVGAWSDIRMAVDMIEVHSYFASVTIYGWARKTSTIPPPPVTDLPPEIEFPLLPPCLPGVPPGVAAAGSQRHGHVRLCEDCQH